MTEKQTAEVNANSGWRIAIALLPALLFISAGGAVWYHWYSGKETKVDPRLALNPASLSAAELREHVTKLTEYIGPRDWGTESGRQSLRQVVAYIAGTLSPQNYGFEVQRGNEWSFEGGLWPALWVDLEGAQTTGALLVQVAYDGEASDLAMVLAVINELRESELSRRVRFVFSPSGEREGMTLLERKSRNEWERVGILELENLSRERKAMILAGQESDLRVEDLPAESFLLRIEGSGLALTGEPLIERAYWLRDFIKAVANRN